MSFRKEKITKI